MVVLHLASQQPATVGGQNTVVVAARGQNTCISDCILLKKLKSRMLQFRLFGGCCVRMNVNPPCLLCCSQIGSLFVIWTLALSCWIKISEGPLLGHFLSMFGMSCYRSIILYTSWITNSVGFIFIGPFGRFFESLMAATLLMKGNMPIFPSNVHCPYRFHLGLATAPKNMALGMNFDDFDAL